MIELSPYEIREIDQKLPTHLAALKTKYPCAVFNAADTQELPPLPEYKPESLEIYYGDEDNPEDLPNISFKNGELDFLHLTESCVNNPVIQVSVDGEWAYIEVEQQILLDRLGEVELPELPESIPDEVLIKTCQLFQMRGQNAVSE